MTPQRARTLYEADKIEIALRREDLYDRRWTRHRDQLLTAVGIASLIGASTLGMPALSAGMLLPAGPRAARWLWSLVASRDVPK